MYQSAKVLIEFPKSSNVFHQSQLSYTLRLTINCIKLLGEYSMRTFLRSIVLILLFIPCLAFTAGAGDYQAGQDYKVLPQNNNYTTAAGAVNVVEFFSYGCPACFSIEPALQQWLLNKPKNVNFQRIPAVFEPNWEILAKAYYIAEALEVTEKITPALFDAIHKQHAVINNEQALEAIFVQQGVSASDFESAYDFSPGIDAQLAQGEKLMQTYQVIATPTFVVNGKYTTNLGMTKGDPQRLMAIVSYLVSKTS